MNLKDSKTKVNLMRAFAGESQARNKYTMAAEQAKKEGYHALEMLFTYTANQEKVHAEVFYNHLKELTGETIQIDGTYGVGIHDSILQVLKDADHNEHQEWGVVYKEFGDIAREEGFEQIARHFEQIANIEKIHGDRFARYAKELEDGILFKKVIEVEWICTNCGHVHKGTEAPQACPVCSKPQDWFLLFENSLFE